jgi:hypothetical protein
MLSVDFRIICRWGGIFKFGRAIRTGLHRSHTYAIRLRLHRRNPTDMALHGFAGASAAR